MFRTHAARSPLGHLTRGLALTSLIAAVVTAASGTGTDAGSQAAGASEAHSLAGLDEAASRFVAETRAHLARLEKLGFAGVVVVARNGAPLLAEGYGLADRERQLKWTPATVSTIGSITKQFTAAAILALEEGGRLDRKSVV